MNIFKLIGSTWSSSRNGSCHPTLLQQKQSQTWWRSMKMHWKIIEAKNVCKHIWSWPSGAWFETGVTYTESIFCYWMVLWEKSSCARVLLYTLSHRAKLYGTSQRGSVLADGPQLSTFLRWRYLGSHDAVSFSGLHITAQYSSNWRHH